MINVLLLTLILCGTVTHDTFLSVVGPPLPPQGNNIRMIASRQGGTLQTRAMFRTDSIKPWHVLDLTSLGQNSSNAQIMAFNVVYWDWNEFTATWQNRQGSTTNATRCTLTFRGDANLDGKVNSVDNDILDTHWQQSGMGWEEGDFNGDGKVTSADLNILALNINRNTANEKADIIYIPLSGDNIALEPVNSSSIRIKTKEAQ